LQALSSQARKKILLDIADALEANEELIKAENDADVTEAQLAGYDKSLVARLALKPGKARTALDCSCSLPKLLMAWLLCSVIPDVCGISLKTFLL